MLMHTHMLKLKLKKTVPSRIFASPRFRFLTLLFALVGAQTPALANIGDTFGFGSRSSALGAASAAWGFDTYSAYFNAAALAEPTDPQRLKLGVGVLYMSPQFKPISNVVVENNYTSDQTTPRSSSVEMDYRAPFGQTLGASYRLFPELWNFTLGVTAFLPVEQTAYMDTGEAFIPEYFLYRARLQRPQVAAAFGVKVLPWLHLGAGFQVGFGLTSTASVFLQTDTNKPSTMRFASSLKPKAGPYFSFLITPKRSDSAPSKSGDEASALDSQLFTLGGTVRLPIVSNNVMTLRSSARALGNLAALDFNFGAQSALFYDPLTIELGATFPHWRFGRFYAQVEQQYWSRFEAPALQIQDPAITGCSGACGVTISPGKNPTFQYKDITVARVGEEVTFGKWTLRAGYAYRPSILSDLPTGNGNYLDPARHHWTGGLGYRFDKFLHFDVPCVLDVHVAYQKLQDQTVLKTAGDEAGTTTGAAAKIGAPGYEVGGQLLGGGVSLQLAF